MGCSKILRVVTGVALLSGYLVFISGTPVMARPEIKLSSAEGAVGTAVTVTGENFDSYVGDELYIYFDNDEIGASPIIVPQTGNFEFKFNVPEDAEAEEHTIRVKNRLGSVFSTVALNTFTVLEPDISLSSRSGAVGKKLAVEGEGFYADRVVAIYFDTVILVTLTASSTGTFSYSFNVPNSNAGAHVIVVKNNEGDSAELDFEVIPQIGIDPVTGTVGSIVEVSGNGFASRSEVSISFKDYEVAYANTDRYGAFDVVSFNVPQVSPSTYDVTVKDEKGNTAKYEFTIIAGVTLDQATASVGGELTLTGTGFEPGGEIGMEFDDTPVATITADSSGAFQIVFNVPASEHGEHVITLSDGVNSRDIVFEIESETPPVPVPLYPEPGSEAKATTYFDWQDVDDPSLPVTYRLQIASGDDFADTIIEKTLDESEYTLSDEEALAAVTRDSPYYWRVKAIDAAANESEWSAGVSFAVLPPLAPSLLLPENGGEAEARAFFDWKDVSSMNPPITYHLQVAQTEDFTGLVMEKKELVESEYTLVEGETLTAVKKDAPYYWRVRAIDGAGNEGQWSAPASFTVGFYLALPSWIIYTLIAIGALIIGFLAFWLGRRTAYSES
jgi:hypothetical protein